MITDKKRPLSPHLSIYRIQITSALSILHRITGIALFFGLLALLWWVIYMTYSTDPQQSWVWQACATVWGKGFLILWSYSLFFHLCTGIRHLFWDVGKGFEIKTVELSGWLAVASSIILASLSWYLAFYGEGL